MKFIAKIIFLGIAWIWMNGAIAETETAPTLAAPKIPVAAKPEKVDRARVEKRLSDRTTKTRNRTAVAEKAAAEREAQAQKPAAGGAPK